MCLVYCKFCFLLTGLVSGDSIEPDKEKNGPSLTLSCSYSSAHSLFWYRQYPGSAPEFLVTLTYRATEAKKSDVAPRFTAKPNKEKQNHVDLEISSAKVTDSVLLCPDACSDRKTQEHCAKT
uniref:Immunoglobulin V-set domain-containing protein n=1 Tax=Cyprinus carpio carpio TaxID=630221 RepID=A0A9J8AYG8_CYPCA